MHRDLLGASLPHSVAGWAFALVAILAPMTTVSVAIERFVELFGGLDVRFRPLAGLAVPLGWLIWSFALLWWKFETATVLSVLLGLLAIVIAMRFLTRQR
jgi:hypothetical protein